MIRTYVYLLMPQIQQVFPFFSFLLQIPASDLAVAVSLDLVVAASSDLVVVTAAPDVVALIVVVALDSAPAATSDLVADVVADVACTV